MALTHLLWQSLTFVACTHPHTAQIIERMERAGVAPDDYTLDAVKNRRSLRTHLKRTFEL